MGLVSIQSIFIHPVLYGWFLAIVGAYMLSAYTENKNKNTGINALVLFIASIFSFRFKTIIAIIFNSFFALFQQQQFSWQGIKQNIRNFRKSKAFLPSTIIGSALGIIAIFAVIQLTLMTIERYITIDYTESARKALYLFGFIIAIKEFPFGVGFGRYGSWTAREHYSPVYLEYDLDKIYGLYSQDPKWATDTYWPSILGELGIIGSLLFITIFVYLILYIYKGYKTIQKSDFKVFLLFALLVIFQSLIESLGEQVFNSGPQYLFIFAIIGLALSIIHKEIGVVNLGIANKIIKLMTKIRTKKEI
jgi:hypothetical protein